MGTPCETRRPRGRLPGLSQERLPTLLSREHVRVLLPELQHLRRYHDHAVSLSRVLPIEILVVVLRLEEGDEGRELSHYWGAPDPLGLDLPHDALCGRLLALVSVEYHGPVLTSHVG